MVDSPMAPEVNVWADSTHAAPARAVLDVMGDAIQLVAIGGPRVGRGSELAGDLGCRQEDDLRKMLTEQPTAFLLWAVKDRPDRDDLLIALKHGTTVLTFEPLATDLHQLDALGLPLAEHADPAATWPYDGRLINAGAFYQSPGFIQAADPQEIVGAQPMIALRHYGPVGEGSLFARLFDSWMTVLRFADLPQSIDAQLSGPLTEVPQQIETITGRLSAHARLSSGGSAVVAVSDQAVEHHRRLDVLGDGGQLRVGDGGYELWHGDSATCDREGEVAKSISMAERIAGPWRRLLDQSHTLRQPDRAMADQGRALACSLACLLSARTGQNENPHAIMQMHKQGLIAGV
jgi:hypothetical protein